VRHAHNRTAAAHAANHERKSRAGKGTGGAAKGGAGGKYTWGHILTNGESGGKIDPIGRGGLGHQAS
jgi:hypothetical protein